VNVEGEWELNPEEIAAIFRTKGWCYHFTDGGPKLREPNPAEVEAMLSRLVKEALSKDEDVLGVQGGRFMVWRDPELPGSVGLYLGIGFVWDDEAIGRDDAELV
jgi:hypothetical protein